MWLACSLLPNGLAGSPRLRVSAARLDKERRGRALASQLSHAASLRPPARRNSCTCRRRASWTSRSGGTADRTAPCTSTPNKALIFPIGERRVAVLAAQACSQVVVVTTDYCHNDSQGVRRPVVARCGHRLPVLLACLTTGPPVVCSSGRRRLPSAVPITGTRRLRLAVRGPVEQLGVLATLSRWRSRVQIPSGPQGSPVRFTGVPARSGSSVGMSVRLKSGRSAVRPCP